MWFFPGLPDKRVGLFVRMHHAIADGIAGVATVGAFLDPAADAPASPVRPWTPAPPPTAESFSRETFGGTLSGSAARWPLLRIR